MDFDLIQFFSRWIHILAAVAAGGGAIFMALALHPATQTLAEEERRTLREAVRSRWSKVVMAAITLLIITGLYNFIVIVKSFELKGTPYHAVFGTKVLLALAIFFVASIMVGRTEMARRVRQNAGPWLTALVLMLVVLLGLSSLLKNLPHVPKAVEPPPAVGGGA